MTDPRPELVKEARKKDWGDLSPQVAAFAAQHAASLTKQRDQAHEALAAEVERRKAAEGLLRRALGWIPDGVILPESPGCMALIADIKTHLTGSPAAAWSPKVGDVVEWCWPNGWARVIVSLDPLRMKSLDGESVNADKAGIAAYRYIRPATASERRAAGLPVEATEAQSLGWGVSLIATERRRQVEREGWTPEHDDEHGDGELAKAAACYADPKRPMRRVHHQPPRDPAYSFKIPAAWPWDAEWWKPTPDDRVRELTKAGALIAAEIDRLMRAAGLAESGLEQGEAARPLDTQATGPRSAALGDLSGSSPIGVHDARHPAPSSSPAPSGGPPAAERGRPKSRDLKPGVRLRHGRTGDVVVIERRKATDDGWWLSSDAGGLADYVIDGDDPKWSVEPPPTRDGLRDEFVEALAAHWAAMTNVHGKLHMAAFDAARRVVEAKENDR